MSACPKCGARTSGTYCAAHRHDDQLSPTERELAAAVARLGTTPPVDLTGYDQRRWAQYEVAARDERLPTVDRLRAVDRCDEIARGEA